MMPLDPIDSLEPLRGDEPSDDSDIFPFAFKTREDRKGEVSPMIANSWKTSSQFFFFYNGLCDRGSIKRFLKAQNIQTLDMIAAAFDMEMIDVVGEKRKREGVTAITKEDRTIVIDAILGSITI